MANYKNNESTNQPIALEKMQAGQIEAACELIARAMNADEARWARQSMRFHFGCQRHGLDDGRLYFVHLVQGQITALVGLHHYHWGPEENVWLAWFGVDPQHQRQGVGRQLLQSIETIACDMRYTKLLVETYSHPDFASAQKFYRAQGFQKAGEIGNYLPDNHSMVVYQKNLGQG